MAGNFVKGFFTQNGGGNRGPKKRCLGVQKMKAGNPKKGNPNYWLKTILLPTKLTISPMKINNWSRCISY